MNLTFPCKFWLVVWARFCLKTMHMPYLLIFFGQKRTFQSLLYFTYPLLIQSIQAQQLYDGAVVEGCVLQFWYCSISENCPIPLYCIEMFHFFLQSRPFPEYPFTWLWLYISGSLPECVLVTPMTGELFYIHESALIYCVVWPVPFHPDLSPHNYYMLHNFAISAVLVVELGI